MLLFEKQLVQESTATAYIYEMRDAVQQDLQRYTGSTATTASEVMVVPVEVPTVVTAK
jgi:hypothetical protein